MKITLIGGGAHRLLPILRGTLASPGDLAGGEICLHDLNTPRAEAMGRMLLKSPEQRAAACKVTWGLSLDESLEGSDAVGVIMPAMPPGIFAQSHGPCLRRGFISSDNVSPTGAMCALRIAPVIMDIALRMEQRCPHAWLVNFVNPVAVLSGMVNNHTKIRAMGVCAGFTNHLWDISRIFGRDEEAKSLDVETAGVNHLSFITKGTWEGQDLFQALRGRITTDWSMAPLQPRWSEGARANISNSVHRLVRFWRDLGVMVFSTEPDGMDHLMYDEAVATQLSLHQEPSANALEARVSKYRADRAAADLSFHQWLDQDLDATFWQEHWRTDPRFRRDDQDIFVRIFTALSGARESKVAVSSPNHGAIAGLKDHHIAEYTQLLSKDGLRPLDRPAPFEVPEIAHGLIAALATHQTMLGDAIAAKDPTSLAHALLSYPRNPYAKSARDMYRDLFTINGDDILPIYHRALEHF